ncbi:MAG: glutamine synthetase family protein [Candidatus Thermoplasmatota archaeon]
MNSNSVTNIIEKQDIKWIQIHFTDLFGKLRAVHIPSERFLKDDIIKKGCSFDGSSVGMSTVEQSDMIAIPDIDTFQVLPHEKDEARVIADVYNSERKQSNLDPRYALKKVLKQAKESYDIDFIEVSPEMEFYILSKEEKEYETQDNQAYFFTSPMDKMKEYRKHLSNLLSKDYEIKYHHHENGRYQQEIEIKPLPAKDAADYCNYFKYLSREIGSLNNLQVSFIPKLFENEAGNGMHAHIRLFKNEKNLFYDEKEEDNISDTARFFISGILDHAKSIAAFANPTVNSYKRLVPHYEAPLYIAWGKHNRSSLIRIAAKEDVDIEIRNADPTANPYLFFAAVIHAGLLGIKKKKKISSIEKDIYKMDKDELFAKGIERLPTGLLESLEELDKDEQLKEAMGLELVETYIKNKKEEWLNYMTELSDLDIKYYLNY